MAFNFVFSPSAKEEYYKAIEWFEEEREGLGERFVEDVNHTLRKIDENPLTYQIHYRNIRMLGTKTFRFCIYYEFLVDTIRIHGVLHELQNRRKIIRNFKK